MGGLGPGYEQALQILMVEYLRYMHLIFQPRANPTEKQSELMSKTVHELPSVAALGASGAMDGAAKHLAFQFFRQGPIGVMGDEKVKDRHIQISKNFPQG